MKTNPDSVAHATFRPKRARFIGTSVACLLGGVLLLWLITDVNKGGIAGANLFFMVGGIGMCAVSLYSGVIFLKQLFAPTLAVSNPLRIEVTLRMSLLSLVQGSLAAVASRSIGDCFKGRVVREAKCGMIGLGWPPVGSIVRPHTGDGAPFAACPKCP